MLDMVIEALTQMGIPLLVLIVAAQWWSSKERVHVRHVCISSGISFLAALGLNQIVILFEHRVRPYDAGLTHLIVSPSTDWSFPSDHATAAFSIAAAFLLHRIWGRGLVFLVLAAIISLTRVYVGTHYVSDLIGGAAMAFATAILVAYLYPEGSRLDRFATGIL